MEKVTSAVPCSLSQAVYVGGTVSSDTWGGTKMRGALLTANWVPPPA